MVSAKDLSNCENKGGQRRMSDIIWNMERSDLLENLHGQLGGNRATGDQLVQGVGQGHSDSVKLAELLGKERVWWSLETYDEPL